jgi:Effector-associated domain 11
MRNTLRNLLADGKTKQAIEQALQLASADKDWQHRMLLIAARFNAYERQQLGGLEDASQLGIELNKINKALLATIEELPEDASPNVSSGVSSSQADTSQSPTIIQNAEKIYNIDHIDNANFS